MLRAVITGVTGHLGQELAGQLARDGVSVWGLTRQPIELGTHTPGILLKQIDGRTQTLVDLLREIRPDVTFHTAGLYRREHAIADISPLIETNILFGAQLLEAMRCSGCRHLVTAGSYFQHFNAEDGGALNLYAATKQAFEDLLAYYVDVACMSAIRLTLPDIYSEHDRRPKLMTAIATAWAEKKAVAFQDEEAWIDPVHVEDTASAFAEASKLLESGAVAPGTISRFSVTCGRDVTASELVTLFARLGGRMLDVTRGSGWRFSRRMKPWRGTLVPDWKQRVTLEDGIRRIIVSRSKTMRHDNELQ